MPGLAAIVDVIVATTEDSPSLGPIAVVLGAGYLIAVVQQLMRQDGRADLVDSLAATVALATVAAFGAAWVVLIELDDGNNHVVVLAGACGAAAVGRLAPGVVGAVVAPLTAGAVAGLLLGVSADVAVVGLGLGVAAGIPVALAATTQARVVVAAPAGCLAVSGRSCWPLRWATSPSACSPDGAGVMTPARTSPAECRRRYQRW